MRPAIRMRDVSKVYRLGDRTAGLRIALTRRARHALGLETSPDPLFWALKDVDFQVEQGTALGIIGPNGAGKTTILKLLSGVTVPTRGEVTVNGRVSALLELGAGFHPELTGRENVYLKAAILGLKVAQIDAIFDRVVEFSGLERFIDTPLKRYSSGMYVRLGFSVAAHVDSEIILVDEVLAVGDSSFRERCAGRVEELREQGTTIVLVSHNLRLMQSLCPRSLFLAEGRLRLQGTTSECISAYQEWRAAGQGPEGQESSSAAHISGVDIGQSRGDEVVVDSAAPFDIDVEVSARKTIEETRLVVRLVREDGVVAIMLRTDSYGLVLRMPEGMQHLTIRLSPLQLSTGRYFVDVRLVGAIDGLPLASRVSPFFRVRGRDAFCGDASGVFEPRVESIRLGSREVFSAPQKAL